MKKRYRTLNIVLIVALLSSLSIILLIAIKVINVDMFNNDYMTYEEFSNFVLSINDNLTFSDYSNLGNNTDIQIVGIDKELSFGRRNFLTLDNEQSSLQTQKRIEYLCKDSSCLAVVDFIYLEKPLYKDMLYWSDPLNNSENEFIRNSVIENMISYKNILIKINLFAMPDNSVDDRKLAEFSGELVDFINANTAG